jgi:hypothetical protein
MAAVFIGWLVVPMLALPLDAVADRRGVTRQVTAVVLASHLVASLVLGIGALSWFNFTYIEDYDRHTEVVATVSGVTALIGVAAIVIAWAWAWSRTTRGRAPAPPPTG